MLTTKKEMNLMDSSGVILTSNNHANRLPSNQNATSRQNGHGYPFDSCIVSMVSAVIGLCGTFNLIWNAKCRHTLFLEDHQRPSHETRRPRTKRPTPTINSSLWTGLLLSLVMF